MGKRLLIVLSCLQSVALFTCCWPYKKKRPMKIIYQRGGNTVEKVEDNAPINRAITTALDKFYNDQNQEIIPEGDETSDEPPFVGKKACHERGQHPQPFPLIGETEV